MNNFPKMKQPEGSLYCGPYCIVACLHALNRLPLTSPLTLRQYVPKEIAFSGPSIDISESTDLKGLALALYKITGIITPGENPDYIEHSGYNSLGAMLYILRQLGLICEVIIRDVQTHDYLHRVFPTEFKLIEKLGVPTIILNSNKSTPNNTMLISVISVNNSLHYILNDAFAHWFDSHLADAVAQWDFIENWNTTTNKRFGATWLGVSIRVSY